ncbi:pyrroline-5-carboxylate reductase dimerization domain-containing protein [Acinetobacter sp. V91_7]|uniref:pyrroline-5-carboxylate reductase family protein n=1 Tax=unclassified Acinetobacter TaxID=196816 RepID=UPI00287BF22C|nr:MULTISPECIES: pyrroline-5-carboxylate reductase dimerization domain-containing protein [unclassified Acinetobacter]MDS7930597.1 pyrroline-5-carboxylate reductase dimerization domain-containing protein [Acinetobacter sp. V102_4]MDS7933033.1 pyrroline-5-carboxylate reductase dimerization domain-containing protein [Acinetobacter sp. V91_4B]MDS7962904.1 pyrroline-5-carboxylate reductase dimerization domain-containing protein [Acinetobacter sp. V91_7]MDS8026107.1 pyrroline-5-carboxylate reductase
MVNAVQPNICFVGSSNLALALIGGLVLKGFKKEKIHLIEDKKISDTNTLKQKENSLKKADIVILLLEPKNLKGMLEPFKKHLAPKVIISMMAGIDIAKLSTITGSKKVVRVISNPPVLTHTGTHVLIASEQMDQLDKDVIEMLYSATGQTFWAASETQTDAIIALSGSGPAYFFYILDSMIKTGVSLGLDKQFALDLALQAASGAVEMIRKTNVPPADLCGKVTLANGITESALRMFDLGNVSDDIRLAMKAAYHRSKEITSEIISEIG